MRQLHDKVHGILKKAGLTRTFWGRRIITAANQGVFTADDRDLAGDWPTCACGKAYTRKPFKQHGIDGDPVDKRLATLGLDFHDNVRLDDVLGAAKTLVKIEDRAAKLAVRS